MGGSTCTPLDNDTIMATFTTKAMQLGDINYIENSNDFGIYQILPQLDPSYKEYKKMHFRTEFDATAPNDYGWNVRIIFSCHAKGNDIKKLSGSNVDNKAIIMLGGFLCFKKDQSFCILFTQLQ